MKSIRHIILLTFISCITCSISIAQQHGSNSRQLDKRQQSIVVISSFTARGHLEGLKKALNDGLEAGLTVNEIKDVLVHLYAYCGFPRSIRGLQTFMTVLDERKARGIKDRPGESASPIKAKGGKYERGKKVLEELTGQKQPQTPSGYGAFSPQIDTFLKEHLFADIFERDIISYTDRELATISALVNLGGVEPMLKSHSNIALNLGVTEEQLNHLLSIADKETAAMALKAGDKDTGNILFPKGQRITNDNFAGSAWLQPVIAGDSLNATSVGNVTFEPGARTKWHLHPGGQILLATDGIGYYQEKGSPKKILRKGDTIKCPPNIPHWHGASKDTHFIQVAITNGANGPTIWLQPVSDEEYNSVQ